MPDILKSRMEAAKDIWQGLEPSDYASLILELKKHQVKTAQECHELYDQLLGIVKKYGTVQTYEMLSKQIGDGTSNSRMDEIKTSDDLDAIVDKLSNDDQIWNNEGRLRDGEDKSQKYAQIFNIGMWWVIGGAISDLKTLKDHGRLEI